MARPFVFLDRDGTLIEERNYLADPDGVVLLPGAVKGLSALSELGFSFAVISNQSGIGRGFFTVDDLLAVNDRLKLLLSHSGVIIDGIYYCPHSPKESCSCRKPLPELIFRASSELGADLGHSFMIGDKICDLELALNSGVTPVLVRTGYGREEESKAITLMPGLIVADELEDAACKIAAGLEVK